MAAPLRLTDDERLDWLRLIRSDNVGPRTFAWLLRQYGDARGAIEALPGLSRRGGASRAIRVYPRADAEREIEAARKLGVALVGIREEAYPQRLAEIDDAPPLLAVRGNAAALTRPMIAMVGSRNASAAGLKFAERLARELGDAGFVIASGLARGIDAAAHRASLATGASRYSPAAMTGSIPDAHRSARGAACPKAPRSPRCHSAGNPRAGFSPPQSLISGLSLGVVIVEAAKRSGSLITARFALEQGREVFAVPGSPIDPRAEGTNGCSSKARRWSPKQPT
jgi:DNA processing protein